MISAELRFEGFDVRSWTHLLSLFMPGMQERLEREATLTDAPVAEQNPTRAGTIWIVDDDEATVLTAQHSLRGRIEELIGQPLVDTPEALCARYGAHRCLILREGVMDELAERLALRYQSDEGYASQWVGLFRSARELLDGGAIQLWPNPMANVPIPSAGAMRRAMELALPDDRAAVMVLFEPRGEMGQLWTAAAIRRRAGEIDLVAGPDLIQEWTGPLGGDWRRDYRIIVDAVTRAVAPVHVGIFSEPATIRTLLRGGEAGNWARQVAVRDLVIHPLPRTYGLALGADAMRGVGVASRRMLGGLDIVGGVIPFMQKVRAQVTQVATISETLGFDPMQVLAAMLQRGEPSEDDPSEG